MKSHIARTLTGIGIIIVGVALLLSNFDVLNFGEIVKNWWPMIIIGAGVLVFINDMKSYLWAGLIAIVGVVLQLRELGIVDVSPWQFIWPAIIVFIGVSVIVNRSGDAKRVSKSDRDDITAILAGSDKYNTSNDFKGSEVTAVMGGVKLDLRKATIKKEATVEIFAFWGGVELVVPRGVVVKNQMSAILGGVEDKSEQETSKNSPVLNIVGDVIMAGVEVKN